MQSRPPSIDVKPPTPGPPPPSEADLKDPALYINRELSWLAFNQRVLDQARDPSHPVLERVKFLAISGANLDEFFMIRVATTLKKLREGLEAPGPDGLTMSEQLAAMRRTAYAQVFEQAACWDDLRPLLADHGIRFLDSEAWTPAIDAHLSAYFARQVAPVLTPLAFDPGHPFPLISNLSKNLAVVVRHDGRTKFARVKIPDVLRRFMALPPSLSAEPGTTFVFLEDVVRANLPALFPGVEIRSAHLFRVIRDSDLELEQGEADDLLETVDRSLRQLRRGAISLVKVDADMPQRVLDILTDNFEVGSDVMFKAPRRLGLADWWQIARLPRPELKYTLMQAPSVWRPHEDPEVIFEQLRFGDVVVHHPYESFATVEAFVRAAVRDPHVVAIKMTLYRIGANSPLIDLLLQAAENGKQIAVVLELQARFDERTNITWARRLESHGVHVIYGFTHLKTHAKLCLVVRRDADGIRGYVHIGTGNYNADTAKVYTDIGLFTADRDLVDDAGAVFNYLTGYSAKKDFKALLVAPFQLRARLTQLIETEAANAAAGIPARIVLKVNSLTDDQVIRALYRASQAGVTIDLIVRGACCLRPGVPGVSDRIRVRSIIGRFLEHSRLYWFLNGGADQMFIGSADLMERNLDRRVEVLTPVRDRAILAHVRDVVLQACLEDTDRARMLTRDGGYVRVERRSSTPSAQDALIAHYEAADTDRR